MLNDARYMQAFAQLRQHTEINYAELQTIRSFVCHMYECKGNHLVDELRYRMYCQSAGKIACDHLPPCSDAFDLHIMRANYQAKIWRERESLLQYQIDMDPLENGRSLDDDRGFSIKWMRCNPGPDEVRIRQVFFHLPTI